MKVYTDGACKYNGKIPNSPGGWGWFIEDTGLYDFGGERSTTNNRMEMTAILEFFKSCLFFQKIPKHIVIYSDSRYCVNTLGKFQDGVYSGWIKDWKPNFTNKKNVDLWKRIDAAVLELYSFKKISFEMIWVKGHSNNTGNKFADELANKGVQIILNQEEK